MPRDYHWFDAGFLENTKDGNRARKQRGLSVGSQLQVLLGTGPTKRRERHAQRFVSLFERSTGGRILVRPGLPHAD